MFMKRLLCLGFLVFCLTSWASRPDAGPAPFESIDGLRYEDYVYQDFIETVLLYNTKDSLAFPMMRLNQGGRMRLHFDDLVGDFQRYSYTFVHCNWDWTPSQLQKQEYLAGFDNNFIDDYEFSFNTIVPYTHYQLEFPNQNVRFLKSGNYLLVVYADNDPNKIVLTRRFLIWEPIVSAPMFVRRPTVVDYRDEYQEIDFEVNHGGYNIPYPYQDLHVVLVQNRRWDNAIYNLQPLFVRDGSLSYNYEYENLFLGGNEYRYFDTKDLITFQSRVSQIKFDTLFQVLVTPDQPRRFTTYSFWPDVNGQRVIRNIRGRNPHVDGDYAMTHFRLYMPEPTTEGNIYVYGGLSDWRIDPRYMMRYNYKRGAYEAQILLKQGYYNYEYVLVRDGTGQVDPSYIEGTHFETENQYSVLVYHREMGQRYDRLVGVSTVNATEFY